MNDDLLDKATDIAFAELAKVEGDLCRLADPFRIVAIITSAQGVIDNGGLRYFFESDWPAQPAYHVFSEAYRTIGATAEGAAIDAAAAVFDFPSPECCEEKRCALLDSAAGAQIDDFDADMTSDVWALLADYVKAHAESFS